MGIHWGTNPEEKHVVILNDWLQKAASPSR
jgi:hypothetical protein